jgi:DNA polymerase-1
MISIQKELKNKKWKSKMLLQVHDELVFDVHKTELDALKIMVKTKMENAFIIDVPLVVDIGVGANWLEAH